MKKLFYLLFIMINVNSYANQWSVVLENDLVVDKDSFYTHGTKIEYTWDKREIPTLLKPLGQTYPVLNLEDSDIQVGLTLGQNLYTPTDITIDELLVDDRPYAGWLYGGITLRQGNRYNLNFLEFNVGIVGPLALGEQTQKLVHKIVNADDPKGWDNQLKNEPGFVISYERYKKIIMPITDNTDVEIIPHAGGSLGNIRSYVGSGMLLKYGINMSDDFNTTEIRTRGKKDFELYGYSDFNVSLLGRNIFLDGNTFTDSHRVSKEVYVGDYEFGFYVRYKDLGSKLGIHYITDEFKTQATTQRFGVWAIEYVF